MIAGHFLRLKLLPMSNVGFFAKYDARPMLVMMVAGFALIGCSPSEPYDHHSSVIACQTSIDTVDVGNKAAVRSFLADAVPLGSGPKCARKVLAGRKMYAAGFGDTAHNIHLYKEISSRAHWRLWNLINLGYNSRGVTLTYRSGKLMKRVVI